MNLMKLVKIYGCFKAAIIFGCMLLFLAYLLPTGEMSKNIARSSDLFNYEGIYPQWAQGHKSTQLDNWTEAYVMCAAIYPSTNAVEDAMNVPSIQYEDEKITLSLTRQANECAGDTYVGTYGRYWHGSLVLLKPLLLLFDVADIRMYNMMLQMGLVAGILILMVQMGIKKYIPAFFAALMVINPVTMAMSFIFSVEYCIMLASCIIVMLIKRYEIKETVYFYLFLIIGILTVYFNELSFPLITLGIPLLFYLWIHPQDYLSGLKKTVLYSFQWALGYGLMWMGKWLCGWIFTGTNYFADATSQAAGYVGVTQEDVPTFIDRIWRNMKVICRWPYLLLFIAILVVVVIYNYQKGMEKISLDKLKRKLTYVLIAIFPILMFIALGNGYAHVHYWFSFRQLAISAAAGFSILVKDAA